MKQYTCSECGSTKVQTQQWVEWNSILQQWVQLKDEDIEWDEVYCPSCQDNPDIEENEI